MLFPFSGICRTAHAEILDCAAESGNLVSLEVRDNNQAVCRDDI